MTSEEKKLFQEFIGKTLNLPETEFNSFFNESGELTQVTGLIESDRLRIEAIRNANEQARKDQYSRGKKEALTELEKSLRTKYEVNSDKTGVELIEEIISKRAASPDAVKLQDDEVLKHPKYAEALRKHEADINELKKQHAAELDAKINEFTREKTSARVRQYVESKIDELKPILPNDPAKARKWKDKFIEEVLTGEFQIAEDGLIYPTNDGKPLQDAHGHIVKFDNLIQDKANSFFEFPAASQRTGSGGGQQQPPINSNLRIDTYEQYLEEMKKADTPEKRMALKPFYEKFKNHSPS
jgi:hypothetical protein